MRRAAVASIIALGVHGVPASAQTIIYDQNGQQIYPVPQPNYGQQPVYVDPNQQPYGQQLPQPQPNYGQPLPQPQPNYGQPLPQPQPTYGQQLPQPQPEYNQPLPQLQPQPQPQQYGEPVQPAATGQGTVPYYQRAGDTPADNTGEATPTGPAATPAINERARDIVAPAPIGESRDRAPQMSAELAELVRIGERYRAASPGFLDDLKALANKYRDPLPASAFPETDSLKPLGEGDPSAGDQTVAMAEPDPTTDPSAQGETPAEPVVQPVTTVAPLSSDSISTLEYVTDDFTDGDYTLNPEWRVRQGEWRIDPVYGLRSVPPAQSSNDPIRPKDILKVLLSGEAPDTSGQSQPQAALIEAPTTVGRAFSLAARIVDHEGKGAAHFIMHQGGADWLGYRLEVRSGPQPVIVLTRRGATGYKDISKIAAPGFTKGETHELRWARLSDGRMFVLLDGQPLITSRDTVFREDFAGFAFFNAGGDVSIRTIRIAKPIER